MVVLLYLGVSRLGVWESLLVSLGRWLVVETPLREVDLIVALGDDRGRQVMAVKLLQQGAARQILVAGADVQLGREPVLRESMGLAYYWLKLRTSGGPQ